MRKRRSLKLGATVAIAVALVVVVLIVVSAGDGSADPIRPRSAADVNRMLEGIPQQGLSLGEPAIPVAVIEFGDMQCTRCTRYAETTIPQLIENQVRNGESKLGFHIEATVGPQSAAAAAAAVAAGEQGRGWNFIEIFYLEQGPENSGYATDEFLTEVARQAGVRNLTRWNREREGVRIGRLVDFATSTGAGWHGYTESPAFAVLGPANYNEFREAVKTNGSASPLEAAIAEQPPEE